MDIAPAAARIAHMLAESTGPAGHSLESSLQKADTLAHRADSMVADMAALAADNTIAATADNMAVGKAVLDSSYCDYLRSSYFVQAR